MFRRRTGSHGFTLVELAIVLGIVGVLAAGLWRLMSTSNQMAKDQTVANLHAQLIASTKSFLASTNGQGFLTDLGANASSILPLPGKGTNTSLTNCQTYYNTNANNTFAPMTNAEFNLLNGFCSFIPTGMDNSTTNAYGQAFKIWVLKDNSAAGITPVTYSFMIVTSGGNTIADTDGGRISSIIGNEGGFIYTSTSVCGSTHPTACGTQGAWQASVTSYGMADPGAGYVASLSFVSPQLNSIYPWLARKLVTGDAIPFGTNVYNTVTQDIYMGTNPNTGTGSQLNLETNGSISGVTTAAIANPFMNVSADMTVGGMLPLVRLINSGVNTSASTNSLLVLAGSCSQLNTAGCTAAEAVTGDISVGGGIWTVKLYSTSDERMKTNIHRIDNPLGDLMKINPVAFTFKSGDGESMGVTAQNLEKVYPQLVSESNGTKFVEYNGLIGPLIGAVQELKHENDSLRDQIKRQELRQEMLEKRLKTEKTAP